MISEGVQGNHRLLLVINTVVEEENKIGTIKATVQPASIGRYPSTSIGILVGNPSIQMYILGGRFQFGDKSSMMSEALD